MQTMHVPTRTRWLVQLAALVLLLSNSGLAQTATPPASDTSTSNAGSQEEEVVKMSPFVVDSSKDEGYQAKTTLAGSRINTDLKNVAQSISVVTKAFIDDVAAVDVNDILAYTANTEGTRDFTYTQSSLGRPSDNIAQQPSTANRVRGLQAADITRDYFYTIGTWAGFDTYNLDEVTIVRGPNSVLAGLGSPAGIINYSPQLAQLSRNKNEVSYRIGSFGDQRATLNSNVVALPEVLAVRVAAVWSDKGFQQKPAWNHDKRLYAALAFKPWTKTTLRASYETIKVNADNPNSLTPEDDVTQWIQDGKPTYDSTSAAPVSSALTAAATNMPTVVYNQYGSIENSRNDQNTGYAFFQANQSNVGIWTAQRMNDNRYFNLQKMNLSPSLQDLRQTAFNISLEQEILPGLYANLAYVKESVNNDFLNLFRTEYAVYMVDVDKYLPGGASNPHFLETYMQFRGLDNKQADRNTNEVGRATVTYDLDLNKVNKWLGRYRATGFVEKRETETDHLQWNAKQVGNSAESIGYRYYLGGNPGNNFVAQTVPQHPGLVSGVTDSYFDSTSGTYKTDILDSYYGLKSDSLQLVKLNTSAVVLQGYLWDDRIVPMVGIRRDKNQAGFSSAAGGSGGNVSFAPRGFPMGAPISKQTKTYGVVVHPLKWLSLHYNHSENFIPNAGSVDLLGNSTPSPTGLTKDYGVSVSLLEDKLNVSVNWFELTAANAAAANANFPLAQWTIPYLEETFMPDLARQAGITYKPLIASGLITGDPRLANAYTSDTTSKGLELEMTYNVTKNWRVMGNISKQEAKQANIASGLTAFIENRLAYWQSIPALWTVYTGQNVGWGVGRTGQQQWQFDNLPYYLAYKSAEGQPSQQLAKWHASVVSTYEIAAGRLKGFYFGGGARYIDKAIIGNPAITDSSGTVVGLDLAHPYYTGGYVSLDAWLGYKTKIYHDKYGLIVQLNIRDLQEGGGYRPITANSDGTHSVFRIVQPRTYYLSTTLEF